LLIVERVLLLKGASIFASVPDSQLVGVAERVEEVTLAAGEALFREGDPGSSLYVVIEGEAVVRHGDVIVRLLRPGDVVGEMAALDPEPRSATVSAVGALRLFTLGNRQLAGLMADHPSIAGSIIKVLCQRLRTARPGANAQPRPVRADAPVAFRAFEPGDAYEVAQSAHDGLGDQYYDSRLLDPDWLRKEHAEGRMVSAVGVSEAGTVFAHAALAALSGAGALAELTNVFTIPAARGRGHGRAVIAAALDLARARGLDALCAFNVTNHTRSQQTMASQGFRDCAVLIGATPLHRLPGMPSTRLSNVAAYCPLRPHPRRVLHAPRRHAEMIERIYAHLGIPAELDGRDSAPVGQGELHVSFNQAEGNTDVAVRRCGADTVEQVATVVELLAPQCPSFDVFLPLADPATPSVAESLEARGWYFGGALPMRVGDDALVLQRLDPRALAAPPEISSELGRGLLAYVEAEGARAQGSMRPR
jgi:GNAT superfamily N-acetyltransferase